MMKVTAKLGAAHSAADWERGDLYPRILTKRQQRLLVICLTVMRPTVTLNEPCSTSVGKY